MTRGSKADFNGPRVPRKARAHDGAQAPADVRAATVQRHRADADPVTGLPSCYSYETDRPCLVCVALDVEATARDHRDADIACGRPWSCACRACVSVRTAK